MVDRYGKSADRKGLREPYLGHALRQGHRGDLRGFRGTGQPAHPPRIARLAGGGLYGARLGHQVPAQKDHALGDLPTAVRNAPGTRKGRSGKYIIGPGPAFPDERGDDPRLYPDH